MLTLALIHLACGAIIGLAFRAPALLVAVLAVAAEALVAWAIGGPWFALTSFAVAVVALQAGFVAGALVMAAAPEGLRPSRGPTR